MQCWLITALSLLLLASSACSQRPVTEVSREWTLDLLSEADTYESKELDLVLQFPLGWVLSEGDGRLYIAEAYEHFPWGLEFYSSPRLSPYYLLYEVTPYRTPSARLFSQERSTKEVARDILQLYEAEAVKGTLLEPIGTYRLASGEASTLAIQLAGVVDYLVIAALKPDHIVVFSANGPITRIDEMQDVIKAIAYSAQSTRR